MKEWSVWIVEYCNTAKVCTMVPVGLGAKLAPYWTNCRLTTRHLRCIWGQWNKWLQLPWEPLGPESLWAKSGLGIQSLMCSLGNGLIYWYDTELLPVRPAPFTERLLPSSYHWRHLKYMKEIWMHELFLATFIQYSANRYGQFLFLEDLACSYFKTK